MVDHPSLLARWLVVHGTYRLLVSCLALSMPLIGLAAQVAAQSDAPSFPYQALVSQSSTVVRSGPGDVHYGTQALESGTVVEVYRHDPGGWAAIRPLDTSFSLIPQSACSVIAEGIVQIESPETQAWVGTQLGAVEQPLWQVKLDAGERVRVLGELSWPHAEGYSTMWYQIAPPAGEFRWVKLDDLQPMANDLPPDSPSPFPTPDPQLPALASSDNSPTTPANSPVTDAKVRNAGMIQSLDQAIAQASHQQSIPQSANNHGWRRSTRPIERFSVSGSPASQSDIQGERFAEATSDDQRLAGQLSQAWSAQQQTMTSAPLPNLAEMENRLTQEMLKDPRQWDLSQLRNAATRFTQQVTDPEQQQGAQRLLAKVIECQRLQQATTGQVSTAAPTGTGNRSLLTIPGAAANDSTAGTFDAVGWLNELKQRNGAAPSTFVLQNEAGKITHHIEPIPGLNLTRYLKTRIGVVGQRGFNQRLGLNHVSVQRVYPLADERLPTGQ